jgi:CRP-like cAMP-binding protein
VTSRKQIAAALGEAPLFSRCTKRALGTIARHAEVASFEPGTELVTQGGPGDAFFVVLDGACEVERDGAVSDTLGPGDFFGELALVDPAPRSATVRTTAPTAVAVLGARMFRTLVREYPDMAEGLLKGMAGQLRAARDR